MGLGLDAIEKDPVTDSEEFHVSEQQPDVLSHLPPHNAN